MLNYKNAVNQAKNAGVKPQKYTVKEGGDWQDIEPFVQPEHVHSIVFSNGQRWDEINGWNFYRGLENHLRYRGMN